MHSIQLSVDSINNQTDFAKSYYTDFLYFVLDIFQIVALRFFIVCSLTCKYKLLQISKIFVHECIKKGKWVLIVVCNTNQCSFLPRTNFNVFHTFLFRYIREHIYRKLFCGHFNIEFLLKLPVHLNLKPITFLNEIASSLHA